MYSIYNSKDPKTPIEETAWGKIDNGAADKLEQDMKDDDWILIASADKTVAPYKVRKGSGHQWLSYCQKPIEIKVVGVFDTVGSLGYPENRFIDFSKWNKPYAFHNTDLHPGKPLDALNRH